jgi:hypothetical protein
MGASSKFFKTLATVRRIVKTGSSVEKDENVSLLVWTVWFCRSNCAPRKW